MAVKLLGAAGRPMVVTVAVFDAAESPAAFEAMT